MLVNFDLDGIFELVSETERQTIKNCVDKARESVGKRAARRNVIADTVKAHFAERPMTDKAVKRAEKKWKKMNDRLNTARGKTWQCSSVAEFVPWVKAHAPPDAHVHANHKRGFYRLSFSWLTTPKCVSWTRRGQEPAAREALRTLWAIAYEVTDLEPPFIIDDLVVGQAVAVPS